MKTQQTTSDYPEMMTRAQAAGYLGISAVTLACWASSKRHAVPFYRVGRKVIYRRADLDAWLATRQAGGVVG